MRTAKAMNKLLFELCTWTGSLGAGFVSFSTGFFSLGIFFSDGFLNCSNSLTSSWGKFSGDWAELGVIPSNEEQRDLTSYEQWVISIRKIDLDGFLFESIIRYNNIFT